MLAVAYGTAAPTLGVAEFAPTANKAIEAPPTTAADQATGSGRARRAATTSTTAPSAAAPTGPDATAAAAPTTRVGRTRTCAGTPPRQTLDPMSPSCVATIFEGDNGGRTAPGVSTTEIRVAIPVQTGWTTSVHVKSAVNALFDHFNRHFELYGRRLVPVLVEGNALDAASARALGATAAAQGVFAALAGYQEAVAADHLRTLQGGIVQELARNGIVTITRNGGPGWSDRQVFDAFHPYVWSVYPSAETNLDNLASFTCRSLAGRPASHAKDATMRSATRKIGVLALGDQTVPATTQLIDGLRACDQDPMMFQHGKGGSDSAALTAGFEKLRSAGATTLICVCDGLHGYYTAVNVANRIGYGPEFVVLPSAMISDEYIPQWSSNQANFIRVDPGTRLLPVQSRVWFGALVESGWQLMDTDSQAKYYGFYVSQAIYEGLLVLSAGVQGAGPALTPDTFAQALMTTQFPNPGAGQAPYWQPSVGFGPGDHSFYDDYAIGWWSATAPAVEAFSGNPLGSWCYVGAGSRFRAGSYPTDLDGRLYNEAEPCR